MPPIPLAFIAGPLILRDYKLWGWGGNYSGELALSPLSPNNRRSSPVQIGSSVDWGAVAIGVGHSVATKTSGTLWAWGRNNYGQLGQNTVNYFSSPVQIGSQSNWHKISANLFQTFSIKNDGTLWAWGCNRGPYNQSGGQLGLNDIISRSSPTQVGSLSNWASVTVGDRGAVANDYLTHCMAIKTDGTLWAWGRNESGELGFNDTIFRSSPTQVGSLTNWSKVTASDGFTVAVKTDGTLWGWGSNGSGQLGFPGEAPRPSLSSPTQIGSLTNWLDVASTRFSTFAIKTDNTLWSFGMSNFGELGLGNRDLIDSPVQVGLLTDWLYVTGGRYHIHAIKTNGTLWSWGRNYLTTLGLNDISQFGFGSTSRSSPTQVGTQTFWSSVVAGQNHSIAITKQQR